MAVIQIPNLPPAIALSGAEELEIVQAGVSRRTTTGDVSAIRYQSPCGAFYSTVTQTHGAVGNAVVVTCNQTDFAYDVSLVSSSRFTAGVSGIYNIEFSLQLVAALNNKHAYVWLRKNGVNVAQSNTEVDLANKDYGYVAAWNLMVSLNAGQYVEIVWTSDDTVSLRAVDPAPYGPAIPSAIVTMDLVRRI